jgi:DnaK suppressor protein
VKKAATPTKKAPATAKKAAPAAVKKVPSSAKKAPATAHRAAPAKKAVPAKKAAPAKKAVPTKQAAPAAKKAPAEKAAAKKAAPAAKSASNGAGAAPTPARTAFTPKPKPPAPVRPKTGPYAKDLKFLDEVTDLLQADRAIYQEQATSLRAEADSLALEREPGDVQFDEESGEGGTVTVDRERNLALSGQAVLAVEEIDDAMVRIKDKTFGYCERCFQPIPKPRLRALPYARLCVACKSGGLSRR